MLRLRRADHDDIPLARNILLAAAADLTARFGEGHWSGSRGVGTLEKYVDAGTLQVIESDRAAVGTLRLTDRKIGFYKSTWFAHPDAYLLDMALHPSRQSQGIGRLALREAESLAASVGLRALRLDAYAGPAGAGGFYAKCGYERVHTGEIRGVPLEYFEKLLPSKT